MKIQDFDLVNVDKVERALHGNIGSEGKLVGGCGDDASEEAILAEYDRLGGLIKKGKYNLKMGCFYDFEKQAPRKKPEVVFVMKAVDGETVEVADGEAIPLEVRAAEVHAEKGKKKVKKAKKSIEDEEEDDA